MEELLEEVFCFSLAASRACLARAKGVLGNSLAEAEAAEGLVGVLVLLCDEDAVTLCESGVLAALGV